MGKAIAVTVDVVMIYQWIVQRWLYPGEAVLVAALLAFVPYLFVRGTITRLGRRGHRVKV